MYTIEKRFSFSASHRLFHLSDPDHPCRRLHGHNYEVVVVLESKVLDSRSFVRDYHDLAPLARFIDERLDHRHLVGIAVAGDGLPCFVTADTPAEVLIQENKADEVTLSEPVQPATAENIARALFYLAQRTLPEVVAVRVSETPKTWAEFRG